MEPELEMALFNFVLIDKIYAYKNDDWRYQEHFKKTGPNRVTLEKTRRKTPPPCF
jgi:hypothetical protein